MALKKIFNTTLIIVCCTMGVVGAIKKYKRVFLTKNTVAHDIISQEIAVASPPPAFKAEVPERSLALPQVDRMSQLFATDANKFPIVETLKFSSKVNWLEGRLAWIADYASHFKTSRHFIARSLNGKADYFSQTVSSGNTFNVYKLERPFDFHIVIDLSSCQMALYYYDNLTNERVLVKTYRVGLGRQDQTSPSGYLTPTGTYKIGSKIAIYKPGIMGTFQDKKVEMIRVFGTRWLPFEPLDATSSLPVKGLGLHGLPWQETADETSLQEDVASIGSYASDGCIRLSKEDIEEIFAVVITKPTFVHLVKRMQEAELPGVEVAQPTR